MCDGKHASKRDVVILSIKPKRPDYPSSQKVVPVPELLQEWDKLDAYYRGQLLKLTRSLQKKSKSKSKSSNSHHSSSSPSKTSHNQKHNSSHHNNQKSTPVSKKHSSSLSSDQFTELFGDENLFNSGGRIGSGPRGPPDSNNNKHNKLLHSRSLNNLFDEDSLDDGDDATILPPPPSRHRKSSLSNNVNSNNLVVSIPVLSVQNGYKHSNKYASDDEDSESGVSDVDDDKPNDKRGEDTENFLSIPRDNFKVQYGTKQKTRVTLLETGSASPKWIVPIKVAPYKPPTAQGLNGIQIQKILYHKNDSVNYPSPTTTTAKTPDKPPDNHALKPAKISSVSSNNSNSPVSTVSPRTGTASTATTPLPSSQENNNATPKQVSPPLSSPSPKGHGNRKSSPTSTITMTTTTTTKLSPPLKSPSCGQKLKRPNCLSLESYYEKKQKLGGTGSDKETENSSTRPNPAFLPVTSTSSTYPFSSFSSSSSASSLSGDTSEMDIFSPPFSSSSASSSSSLKHAVGSGRTGGFMDTSDSSSSGYSSASGSSSSCGSSPAPAKKLNIIHKNPPSTRTNSAENKAEKEAVFISPAAVSITDRIIKKASQPQPELIERQRRRKMESNQRKSYAMQKGDEHEEKESIDLSMKSFEMIWNIPLLSPLRSP